MKVSQFSPRIQLTRQDEAVMSAARERQAVDLGLLPAQGGDQQVGRGLLIITLPCLPACPFSSSTCSSLQDEDDDYEEVPASPEHPGRSRFNMTNIMEGSLEDSR